MFHVHRVALLTVVVLASGACAGAPDDSGEPRPASTAADDDAAAAPDDEPEDAPDESPEEPVGSVTFSGTDDLTWAEPELTAPAGLLEITLECGAGSAHTLVVFDVNDDRQLLGCAASAANTKLVTIDPGTYTYVCTVPGHHGMRGTLTVG